MSFQGLDSRFESKGVFSANKDSQDLLAAVSSQYSFSFIAPFNSIDRQLVLAQP